MWQRKCINKEIKDDRRKRKTENKGGVKEKERKRENGICKLRSVERKGKEY